MTHGHLAKSQLAGLDANELVRYAAKRIDLDYPDDADPALDAILELQARADQKSLDVCIELCRRESARDKRVGAIVLGQFGYTSEDRRNVFRNERYACLAALLEAELTGPSDPKVLSDICYALGWLHDPRVIPLVLPLRSHPDTEVRRGVRHALEGHDVPEAIEGLIELSGDPEPIVRDWATFSLAQQIDTDTSAIREALYQRLTDPDEGTRAEAMMGMCRRKDPRVIPALIEVLTLGEFTGLMLDAAMEMADPKLCSALQAAHKHALERGSQSVMDELQAAMESCRCRSGA
ncbi:HEAT repeat domain-containing protein [Microvirga sp. 2YAF29]|uniref:HEAT repeat domain-containing protein n=1 Tax=Microvirga sp. 2YAF29 TaxID=3233031 RepID=UPI003F9CC1F6